MDLLISEEKKLENLYPIVANLKKRRDKKYVHNDKEYWATSDKLSKDAPFSYNDFDTLLNFADDFCNLLAVNLDMGCYLTQSMQANDLFTLLEKLPIDEQNE